MNYSELTQMIQDEVENTEATFVSHIPDFIRATERSIALDTRLPVFRSSEETPIVAATLFVEKPTDLIALQTIAYINSNVHYNLTEKDFSFIREAYPNSTTTGTPRYYAEVSETDWLLAPAPASNGTIRITGIYLPTSIVSASTTWIGNNAPNALLYGCLREAYIYMKGDDDVLAMYEARYRDEIDLLKGIDRNIVKGDEFRRGQAQTR